jgi:hypothetical protein
VNIKKMDKNKMKKKSSLSPINMPNNILFDAIVSNFNTECSWVGKSLQVFPWCSVHKKLVAV